MHSLQDSLLQAMSLAKYKPFVGVEYEAPHGCFKLVEKVYKDLYGINLGGADNGLENAQNKDRTVRMQEKLAELGQQVKEPREGDVIIIRSRPWHIGLIIEPGWMLHSYSGGTSCIESYNEIRWINRIEGFYRYVGKSTGE